MSSPNTAGSRRIGRYEVVRKLGSGGMGEVYLALDPRLDRQVAIKVLPPDFAADPERIRRFLAEARLASAVTHPNAAHIYELGEAEGAHFIALEYVEGVPLNERIGSVTLPEALRIAAEIADALAAAHGKRVIHRDVKPANVMITHQGGVKLLDFGLARREFEPGEALAGGLADLTTPGLVIGTLPYMSPEQALGRPLDSRTDMFSFGVVLYELLTSRRPFEGRTTVELIDSILHHEPVPPRTLNAAISTGIEAIVMRCLAKDPERRYPSMAAVAASLRELRTSATPPAADVPTEALSVGVRSVAVLPFSDLSQERDQQYFCDGIAEEISIALSKVKRLRVAFSGPNAINREVELRELGRRLDVDTLLDGSVRKAGSRLRVVVRLIQTSDGFVLWSEKYDRDLQDIFAVQEEVALHVAAALELTFGSSEREAVERRAPRDVRAYEYYLRGRELFYRATRSGYESAIEMFRRAVEIDPAYARAYAGLAYCWTYLYDYHGNDPAALAAAEEASVKAVELDPRLAESHVAWAQVAVLREAFNEAEAAFRRASDLDPTLFEAPYFLAVMFRRLGRYQEAAAMFLEANKVRPEDHRSLGLAANIYDGLGRHQDAAKLRRRVTELLDDHLRLAPDDAKAMIMQGNTWIQLGERERGLEYIARAATAAAEEPLLLYNVACGFALAGDYPRALATLEQSVDKGFRDLRTLEHDSDFIPLREDERFAALVARLRTDSHSAG